MFSRRAQEGAFLSKEPHLNFSDEKLAKQRVSERRSTLAAMVGSLVEYYDFTLYGASAAVVFSRIFFTGADRDRSVIFAFLTFGAGFLARPLGGVVFGHFGDRIGRRPMLAATIVLMSVATAAIGLLPSRAAVGPGIVLVLVGLRCLQGFGAGAEYAGAVLLAGESHKLARRGLAGSLPITGVWLGSLLSVGVFSLCSSLPEAQFLNWGWRVPFLLNILIGAFGLWIRSHIPETPAFQAVASAARHAGIPAVRAVRDEWRKVLVAMGANATLTFYSFIVQVFCISYMVRTVGLPAESALAVTAAAYLAAAILSPLWGLACDRVGAQKVYMAGAVFSLFYAPVLFYLLDQGNVWLAGVAIALALGVGLSAQFAAQATFLIGLFPVGIRYSGIAISREVTGALLSGPGPAVAALLVAKDHGHWGFLAAALAGSALVVILSLLCAGRLASAPQSQT